MSKRNSNRIVVIQFICTISIVIQHGTNLIPWNLYFTNYKWAIFFEEFIEHITHIAVPVFFYFSGYLMFVDFNYIRKIKKRLRSLVIPYVLWNLICALFLIGVEQISFLQHKINRPKEQLSFNLLKEIWLDCSFNGPLWYLRNLIIISLLSIIIYYLLYQKVLGQIIIIGCCIFNLINNFNYYGIVYWMPEYLMGAYVAIHGLPRIYPIYGEESLFSYILNKKKNWFIVFSAILCKSSTISTY